MPDCVKVARQTLTLFVWVRILVGQPQQINIPPQSGGYFRFRHSPNTTGNAQVRFLLACQPRIGLLATRKRVSGIVKTYLITFSIHL